MKKFCLPLAVALCITALSGCYQEGGTGSGIASSGVWSDISTSDTTTSSTSSQITQTETSSTSSQASQEPQSQVTSTNKTSSGLVSKLPPVTSKPTIEEVAANNSQKARDIILKNTKPEMTDIEKMKATYKWLYPHFKYRTASVNLSNGFTKELETELAAYFFKYHKGSCEHYAAAQKALINELGYECMFVIGERYSSISHKWGEHTWLLVKVNDNWYHVDGLFGGLFYNVIETTFMVPDSALEKTHRWDKSLYPPCINPQLLK